MDAPLLHEPHHDGSALYLDPETPAPGWPVRVRLRTWVGDDVEAVAIVSAGR